MREDLEFKLRMRASLARIVPLDPASVRARLAQLDREIRALEAVLERDAEVLPLGRPRDRSVRAA